MKRPACFGEDKLLNAAGKAYLLSGSTSFNFPLRITKGVLSELQSYERYLRHVGYEISFVDRRVGGLKQGVPESVSFDIGLLLKLRPEFRAIKTSFDEAKVSGPSLRIQEFLESRYAFSVARHRDLASATRAANFVIEHQDVLRGLYIRQIPHGQSTKLFEKDSVALAILSEYWGERVTREDLELRLGLRPLPRKISVFSPVLVCDGHRLLGKDISISSRDSEAYSLAEVDRVLIVENPQTYYALIEVLPERTALILGHGNQITNGEAGEIKKLIGNRRVYYWGDIDQAGYAILNSLKRSLPEIMPVCMNLECIERFEHLAKPNAAEQRSFQNIELLTEEFKLVSDRAIMIEQEQIDLSYFGEKFSELIEGELLRLRAL